MPGEAGKGPIVDELRTLLAPRAKGLIMTFWGDMLLPFGGRIWLGSLVQVLTPLGLDERSVRTAVSRLVTEGWLATETVGRRREISMPEPALDELRAVQRRMYSRRQIDWDGHWTIVVVRPSTPSRREALRRELTWQGYAGLSPNTMIHPRQGWSELSERLAARGLDGEIAHVFSARSLREVPTPACLWPLEKIEASWKQLHTLVGRVVASPPLGDDAAFAVRLLLVHALRLVVLRDPALPDVFHPDNWPEPAARSDFLDVYQDLSDAAHRHLEHSLRLADDTRPSFRPAEFRWRLAH